MVITYSDSITGSGKTTEAIDLMFKKRKEKFIMVVPNKRLCKEIHDSIKKRDKSELVQVINQDTVNGISTTTHFSKEFGNLDYRIIITTHVTFMNSVHNMSMYTTPSKWNLIIDEELALYAEHDITVSQTTVGLLTGHFSFIKKDENFYTVNQYRYVDNYNMTTTETRDDFLKLPAFLTLNKFVFSPRFETLIPVTVYDRMLACKTDIRTTDVKFTGVSVLKDNFLSKFKSVLILSAFFEHTIMYKLLTSLNVKLNKVETPQKLQHNNSELITMHYFTESNWSKSLRTTIHSKNTSYEDAISMMIVKLLNKEQFIYNTNLNSRGLFNDGTLVTTIHGVNEYIEYNNMVFMPSLNATSNTVSTLSSFGMSRKEIDFSRNVLSAYQFVSRGCLRKEDNDRPVNIFVMDKRTVDFLETVFPKAKVIFHGVQVAKNPIPSNVRSFMSRYKNDTDVGKLITQKREKTYNEYYKEYYKKR